MNSVIFATKGLPFNKDSITSCLGGSESAALSLLRELRTESDIMVFNSIKEPQSNFYPIEDLHTQSCDTLIISRYFDLVDLPIERKKTILWAHDMPDPTFASYLDKADVLVVLSEFQKKSYQQLTTTPISIIRHGITESCFEYPDEMRLHNYVYASRPERGLETLLFDIWPEICKKNPKAHLNICSYVGFSKETEDYLKTIDSVTYHGMLDKIALHQLFSRCSCMLYPTSFPETSCIAAMEAQSQGCVVVGTKGVSALDETVVTDTLIHSGYEYFNRFVSMTESLSDINIWKRESSKAKLAGISWSAVAKQWKKINNE